MTKPDNTWPPIRDAYLEKTPWCEYCKRYGNISEATVVHHIHPAGIGGKRNHDEGNLLAVCRNCHKNAHDHLAIYTEIAERIKKEG